MQAIIKVVTDLPAVPRPSRATPRPFLFLFSALTALSVLSAQPLPASAAAPLDFPIAEIYLAPTGQTIRAPSSRPSRNTASVL